MTKEVGVNQLRRIFKQIILNEKCPKEWEDSDTVVVYKGKDDALDCGNYKGVRLLEHSMKVWEKVLEARLREIITINENQLGFSPGKSTIDGLFVLRQLQEKYGGMKKDLHNIFVDLEKAFDRVIEWALKRQNVPERTVQLIMALYVNTNSRVKTFTGTSKKFEMKVGDHQGSALSPLLFILVMEEATRECRKGALWEMLYADDLALTAESKDEVKSMFMKWRGAMELRGLKINIRKTKYMVNGKISVNKVNWGRWPCGCCGRGVGSN